MADRPQHPSLSEATWVWARVAALSFGGPAGQIAVMHRILVDERRWISENRFLHALNYCMLLPGPEAQQLATYVGWLLHGTVGGVIAGGLFILPGIVSILALSMVYAAFGKVGIVTALFFGLKAAVLAVVLEAVVRIGRRALGNAAMRAIAAAAFVAIYFFGTPFPAIVLAAGVLGLLAGRVGWTAFAPGGRGPAKPASPGTEERAYLLADNAQAQTPRNSTLGVAAVFLVLWLAPVAALVLLLGPADTFSQIALLFSKMAVVTFGGAYAALAYVAQQAVETYAWLRPGEMLDGLGMAETTPGPLIMVLQFVGYMAAYRHNGPFSPMAAGVLGSVLATWVTFTPCFLWIFLGAPYVEVLRGNRVVAAALSAITAAVVGVILNLAVWFAVHVLFSKTRPVTGFGLDFEFPVVASANAWSVGLSAAALLAMFRFKAGMLPTLAGCALAGIALHLAGLVG